MVAAVFKLPDYPLDPLGEIMYNVINQNKIKMTRKIKLLSAFTLIVGLMLCIQTAVVLASNATSFSQVINAGSQSVDIVDGSGVAVGSPSVSFAAVSFSFDSQTTTGTLGVAAQKIRVYNPTSDDVWTVSMAATGGATGLWTDGGTGTYDFNDTGAAGSDDADADSKGGRLTIDPSGATVAGVPDNGTCPPTTNITKGSSAPFKEVAPATSSVTLLSGAAGSTAFCRWDMTNLSLSQVLPASQSAGTYTLSFTITIA